MVYRKIFLNDSFVVSNLPILACQIGHNTILLSSKVLPKFLSSLERNSRITFYRPTLTATPIKAATFGRLRINKHIKFTSLKPKTYKGWDGSLTWYFVIVVLLLLSSYIPHICTWRPKTETRCFIKREITPILLWN